MPDHRSRHVIDPQRQRVLAPFTRRAWARCWSLPFALGGTTAGRLFLLALLIAPILGWACWRWFRRIAHRPANVALAHRLACFSARRDAVRIGPGLPRSRSRWPEHGACRVAIERGRTCRHVCVNATAPSRRERLSRGRSGGLVAGGFIPWLHIRFLATAVVLIGLVRRLATLARSTSGGRRRRAQRLADVHHLAPQLTPVPGRRRRVASAFQFSAYMAIPFGARLQGNALTGSVDTSGQSEFWSSGEHLDQSNGVFLACSRSCSPGLVAIGWMIRTGGIRLTIPWLLLYSPRSIVPQAMLDPSGAACLSGRFNLGRRCGFG